MLIRSLLLCGPHFWNVFDLVLMTDDSPSQQVISLVWNFLFTGIFGPLSYPGLATWLVEMQHVKDCKKIFMKWQKIC